MPSDPGRPFTQQPSKSHRFVFTFPKKYWERKDEIISGQKRMQVTVHFESKSYRSSYCTHFFGAGMWESGWRIRSIRRGLPFLTVVSINKNSSYRLHRTKQFLSKERSFYTYVLVYLFHLFHQCPQRRETRLFFQILTPYGWRRPKKSVLFFILSCG